MITSLIAKKFTITFVSEHSEHKRYFTQHIDKTLYFDTVKKICI